MAILPTTTPIQHTQHAAVQPREAATPLHFAQAEETPTNPSPEGAAALLPMTFESPLLWSDPQAAAESKLASAAAGDEGAGSMAALNPGGLRARLHLDERACARLQVLWLACQCVNADEIGDWTVGIACQIEVDPADELFDAASLAVPAVVAVSATVYSNGEVNFELVIDGAEQALRLQESLHLSRLPLTDTTQIRND